MFRELLVRILKRVSSILPEYGSIIEYGLILAVIVFFAILIVALLIEDYGLLTICLFLFLVVIIMSIAIYAITSDFGGD